MMYQPPNHSAFVLTTPSDSNVSFVFVRLPAASQSPQIARESRSKSAKTQNFTTSILGIHLNPGTEFPAISA